MASKSLQAKIRARLKSGGEMYGTYADIKYKFGLDCNWGEFRAAIDELVKRGLISRVPRKGFPNQFTLTFRNK